MAIYNLTIENFKRFEFLDFDMSAPINVLVGENSSGKSSIVKAILGFKQTVSTSNEHEVWAAQGEYVDLGIYENYVHGKDVRSDFSISFNLGGELRKYFALRSSDEYTTQCDFLYGFEKNTEQARLKSLNIKVVSDGGVEVISAKRKRTSKNFLLEANDLFIERNSRYFPNLSPQATVSQVEKFRFEAESGEFFLCMIFNEYLRAISEVIDSRVFYVGPLRESPMRSYSRSSHKTVVGVKGENTASVLAYLQSTRFKSEKARLSLLNKWVSIIFDGKKVKAVTSEDVVKLCVEDSKTGKYFSSRKYDHVVDIGFGFSQLFPILVQMSAMDRGDILILEQPELHLHPKVQSKFAEIVVEAAEQGRRFLIETHSEHMIRGMQLIISQRRSESNDVALNEYVSINYVNKYPGSVKKLRINEYGEFDSEWPSGFFDESYRLSMELLNNKVKALGLAKRFNDPNLEASK